MLGPRGGLLRPLGPGDLLRDALLRGQDGQHHVPPAGPYYCYY